MGVLTDLGKNLGILEKDPVPAPPPPKIEEAPKPAPKMTASTASAVFGFTDPQQKQKYLAVLDKAIQDADLPGPDFLEFLNGLRGLAAASIPEEMKFTTALTMFGAQGVTPKKLVETSQHYLDAMEAETNDFNNYIAASREEKITKLQAEADQAVQAIQAKSEQIKKLQEEIASLNAHSLELKQTAALNETEIDATVQAFNEAKASIAGELTSVVNRLNAIINIPK